MSDDGFAIPANTPGYFSAQPAKLQNWYLTSDGAGADLAAAVLRVERTDGEPRVYVDGELTSDVERIGAAFVRWAKSVAGCTADSEGNGHG